MNYRVKANVENFVVVDGPFTGKKFQRGKRYRKEEIPENEMHRFEAVVGKKKKEDSKTAPAPAVAATATVRGKQVKTT